MVRNPRELKRLRASVDYIQYRPDEGHQSVSDYDEVYKWCYRRQSIMIYTDEAFLVHHGSYAPDWLRACVTCGRELNIGMITGTQRPRGIDLRLLTEAEIFCAFELRHREDRKRMAEMGGEEFMERPPKHAFWIWAGWGSGCQTSKTETIGGSEECLSIYCRSIFSPLHRGETEILHCLPL